MNNLKFKHKIVKAKPEIISSISTNEQPMIVAVIDIEGVSYMGAATLHPDDEDFFSSKVGATIAHMRAIYQCFKTKRNEARKLYIGIKELAPYVNNDCTDIINQAYKNYKFWADETSGMGSYIRKYTISQSKAIDSLKYQRKVANVK